MAKVISILNRKGGVGKTTLSIALAETIVWERSEDVLLIDLDPQASASEALMSPAAYEQVREADRTLPCHLQKRLDREKVPASQIVFAMAHALEKRHSVRLDLVPNDERLWDLEWDMATGERKRFEGVVQGVLDELAAPYDWVLIDCPPGRIATQRVATSLSDFLLCPVIPSRLSHWGMDRLRSEFERAEEDERAKWAFALNAWSGKRDPTTLKWIGSVENHGFLDKLMQANLDQYMVGHQAGQSNAIREERLIQHAVPDREIFRRRIARLRETPRRMVTLNEIYEDSADVLRKLLGYIEGRLTP